MAVTPAYRDEIEKHCSRIVFQLLSEKLFTALGVELSTTRICLFSNDDFPLCGRTFAFFNPLDASLNINIEDPFFTQIKLPEESPLSQIRRRVPGQQRAFNLQDVLRARLLFILFHEAYHKLLMHADRKGHRDSALWNVAADYEIHNLLHLYCEIVKGEQDNEFHCECELICRILEQSGKRGFIAHPENGEYKFLFSEDLREYMAEEIYAMLEKSKCVKQEKRLLQLPESGGVTGVTVTESTYTLPDGSNYTALDFNWPNPQQLPPEMHKSHDQQKNEKNNAELRRQMMAQELQSSVTGGMKRGTLSAQSVSFLQKLLRVRVDWGKILKQSLQTMLCRSDYCTWARPRTSMYAMDMYLPDVAKDNEGYGALLVARDESGSMSDAAIARCGAIIADAKEHYRNIIVLKHDVKISYVGEFEELTDAVVKMLCTRNSRGGTSHKAVFEYIANYAQEHPYGEDAISCVILMTDCHSDIQRTQNIVPRNIPLVYLVPKNAWTAGIRGQIIPVDL